MPKSLFAWFGKLRSYLSSPLSSGATPEIRARERQRRVFLSTAAALFGKTVAVGTSLISIPLALNYLGTERFGLWMTISSIVALLAFADLGIGNGLLNAISAANGLDDIAAVRRHISSAAIILSGIAGVLLVIFCGLYSFIPWPTIFNVHSSQAAAEAGPAVFVFMFCFAINVPAAIVQRVQLGLQLGFVANLWQTAGSVMALAAVLVAVNIKASLPALVFAIAGMPVIASLLNGVVFFGRLRPELSPRFSLATRQSAYFIARTGILFLVLQLVAALTYSSDNLIVAHYLGAAAVTTYAIPEKLFSFISVALSIMLTPLWPAYGEAISRGDRTWVRAIFRKSLGISVAVAACLSLTLAIFGQEIIDRWIGHPVAIPFSLIIGLGIWKIFEAAGSAFAVLFNGANVVGFQVMVAITTAITAILAKLYLVGQIGISGPVFATVGCYGIFALLPYALAGRKIIRTNSSPGVS
jgi:O-antigen/teichoic acid export membrane protein